MTLLQQLAHERCAAKERLRAETRHRLQDALAELLPGQEVIVFGSLTRPGRFSDVSDVDIALHAEPPDMSTYQLISLLAEHVGRPVDVLLLPECRFRDAIEREGERWVLGSLNSGRSKLDVER